MQDYIHIYRDLYNALCHAPSYHLLVEGCLILFVFYIWYARSWRPKDREELSQKEKDQLVAEWQPEPLVPKDFKIPSSIARAFDRSAVSALGKYVEVSESSDSGRIVKRCLNLASFNYLNFVGDEGVEKAAVDALRHYGVGSCGPRGFYGTMDVHLRLEKDLAQFLNGEEAILYSYGFSTIASAIPAYAKRNDILYADEAVSFSVRQGLMASRSRIHFFRHNDYKHLEELLQQAEIEDKKDPGRAKVTRKFMVVEGLYLSRGTICPLPEFIKLKYKYKVRIFVEESHSFGVLGATGRGVTEHTGVDISDVELVAASLENAVAGGGGFCCGSKFVVDHQRLSGQGYTFSASLPPLLAASACHVLGTLDSESANRSALLQEVSRAMHKQLEAEIGHLWDISSDPVSPIKHLRLHSVEKATPPKSQTDANEIYEKAMDAARARGLLITLARYLPAEPNPPRPSIRLALNYDLSEAERAMACNVLLEVGKNLSPICNGLAPNQSE